MHPHPPYGSWLTWAQDTAQDTAQQATGAAVDWLSWGMQSQNQAAREAARQIQPYVEQATDALTSGMVYAERLQAAGRDWLTTATVDEPWALDMAVEGQLAAFQRGEPLSSIDAETHGVMTTPGDDPVAVLYRAAYWTLIGARLLLTQQVVEWHLLSRAERLLMKAREQADRRGLFQVAAEQLAGMRRSPWSAALPAAGADVALRSLGVSQAAAALGQSAAPAYRAFLIRAAIVTGATGALVVGAGVATGTLEIGGARRNPARDLRAGERAVRVFGGLTLAIIGALGWLGPQASEPITTLAGGSASVAGVIIAIGGLTGRDLVPRMLGTASAGE